MDCSTCPKAPAKVDYIVYETALARKDKEIKEIRQDAERREKRQFIWNVIVTILCIGMLIGFFAYESQFETVEESKTQSVEMDADNGSNHFVGGDYNG